MVSRVRSTAFLTYIVAFDVWCTDLLSEVLRHCGFPTSCRASNQEDVLEVVGCCTVADNIFTWLVCVHLEGFCFPKGRNRSKEV